MIVGIEGGGTKTRVLVGEGNTSQYREFNTSVALSAQPPQAAAQKLYDLLGDITYGERGEIESLVMGIAGGRNHDRRENMRWYLKQLLLLDRFPVTILSDAELALKAAVSRVPGAVLLIAGTGSVACALDAAGEVIYHGGWGRAIGDEGSGYSIGLAALRHYARVIDGRDAKGKLYEAIDGRLTDDVRSDPRSLNAMIQDRKVEPANFAPLVFETEMEDAIAARTIQHALTGLENLLSSLVERVGRKTTAVFASGSIAQHPLVQRELAKRLSIEIDDLPAMAPVEEALRMAGALKADLV